MSKKYQKKSYDEKKKQVEELTKNMEKSIENHFHSPDDLKEYLTFMSKFYKYSPSNIALIQNRFFGAEAVGSFKFWKDNGFSVNKGEKGIPILVPNKMSPQFKDEDGKWKSIKKANEQEKQLILQNKTEVKDGMLYFSVGYVFDISQTNATKEDLPKIFPNKWLEGNIEDYKLLYKGMEAIAEKNGIAIIPPKEELGVAKGVSYTLTKEVALNPRNSEIQNVKTLLHELGHAKLHTKDTHDKYTDAEREFQAEMTAYTVSSYFGIDTTEYSLEYLHHWTKDKEFKDKNNLLKEVHETSVEFISTIEETLQNEKHLNQVNEVSKDNFDEKSILLVNYGYLSHTENSLVSFNELMDLELKDEKISPIKNKEELSVSEYIDQFNKSNQAYAAIEQKEIKEPHVLIQWSESELETNTLIPLKEANAIMSVIAENQEENLGYLKTRYHVVLPNDEKSDMLEVINMDRLDLGDGLYKSPLEQIEREKPSLYNRLESSFEEKIISRDLYNMEEQMITNQQLMTIYSHANPTNNEVATLAYMDNKTSEIHTLAVSNSNDNLYLNLGNESGERDAVPLQHLIKPELHTQIQEAVFDLPGESSFSINESDLLMDVNEFVNNERYTNWVERADAQEVPVYTDKEMDIYSEMLGNGYRPLMSMERNVDFENYINQAHDKLKNENTFEKPLEGSLEEVNTYLKEKNREYEITGNPKANMYQEFQNIVQKEINSQEKELSPLEKDLVKDYQKYYELTKGEKRNDINSSIDRAIAEDVYFSSRNDALDKGLITKEEVTKLERSVERQVDKTEQTKALTRVFGTKSKESELELDR